MSRGRNGRIKLHLWRPTIKLERIYVIYVKIPSPLSIFQYKQKKLQV